MAGELVVAEALGVPMPQRYDTKIETDGGWGDLILPNGETVSVKVLNRFESPWGLYTSDPDDFRDDYGVLVWGLEGRPDSLAIVGWFDRDLWKRHWRLHRYGKNYPERAVIDYVYLRPISELREKVDRMRGN